LIKSHSKDIKLFFIQITCGSFELSIHQIIQKKKKITVSTKILNSTTVFYIDKK